MAMPTKEEMYRALEERHGAQLQRRLSNTCVAICGLGGLGSNIAVSLARAGVGKLQLIDFDKVDISNLNRQQYFVSQLGMYKTDAIKENLQKIAPYVEVTTDTIRVCENNVKELLQGADIICEAFDRAEQKAMLVNAVLEQLPDKYLVSGSGMAGISSANTIKTRKLSKHFYLCGDGVSDVNDNIGLVSSRVMVCAGHEAHMIVRIIAEEFDA
jgi:sulfur carrier protein ThiS adenylyltransferase